MAYPKLTPVIAADATEPRYVADRFADKVSPLDFGAKGDGSTNDTQAFLALEESYANRNVDLLGKTYVVNAQPYGNYYYNGVWLISGYQRKAYDNNVLAYIDKDGAPGRYDDEANEGSEHAGTLIEFGTKVNFIVLSDVKPEDVDYAFTKNADIPHMKQVVALGPSVMKSAIKRKVYLSDNIGIGSRIMSTDGMASTAQHNIGIGDGALWNLTTGDRNIGIGSTALAGCKDGSRNIALGRDTAWGLVSGSYNTFVGVHCHSGGGASISLDGTEHVIFPDESTTYSVAIGGQCLKSGASKKLAYSVVVGGLAANKCVSMNCSNVIGYRALDAIDTNVSPRYKNIVKVDDNSNSATYVAINQRITVTKQGHSAVVGCYVALTLDTGDVLSRETQRLVVESKTSDSFVLIVPYENISLNTNGNCTILWYEQDVTPSKQETSYNDIIGSFALLNATEAQRCSCIGYEVCKNASSVIKSTCIGFQAGHGKSALEASVVIGNEAGIRGNSSKWDVIIGHKAGQLSSEGTQTCTFVGCGAGETMLDGSVSSTKAQSVTCLGYNSKASGNSQVQLGSSATTTYAYGAVQDRSDARDKTDIRDTVLGLDFLLSLRPVDFKWDYRDDYIDVIERDVEGLDSEGKTIINTETEIVVREKDGSRKRNRYHHGLIAQEVKSVLDEKGIDFGGYQDHSINGGKDVLTLGYEEFIAPIIKALQEIDVRLKALEA